ncbi:MAG: twin-arginine translocase TatA/TatE family subunit [Pyrinomonadaceae bacterium]
MFGLGAPEMILIVVALFLLFGATRLPQLAKSLGQSRKAFKDGLREAEEEEKAEQQKLTAPPISPQVSQMDDAALAEEMRRRAEVKT